MSHDPDRRDRDEEHPAKGPHLEQEESSPSTPEPFLYRQLSGSEIRLIRILSGYWDDPIRCELLYVPLDDRPKYAALSYAWGDPTETQSLFTGLRRLRDKMSVADKNSETFITENLDSFFLWADAICINQEDEDEKIRQISRMGDIYRVADKVFAWLGENGMNEAVGIHRIMGMAHCVGMASDVWEPFLVQLFDNSVDDYDIFARGIINLSMRPWLSRVWVVQEVALASKAPIILAGRAWSYLDSLYKLVMIIEGYSRRSLHDLQGWEKATLPHDYIYGLLGLVGIEALPPALKPDYNRPYAQVCQDYARFIFESTGDLSLLLRPGSKISGVPSWVPDFSANNSYAIHEGTEKNLSPISFSDNGSRMTILALELGTCVQVWVPPSEMEFYTDSKTNSNPVFELSTIQLFDSFLKGVSDVKKVSKDKALEDWLQEEKEFTESKLSIEELKVLYNAFLNITPEVGRERSSVRRAVAGIIYDFSIIVIENGTLAWLFRVDREAKVGDVLVTVRGTVMPLLLRPTKQDSMYEYLGFCIYKGLEYGEGLFSDQILKSFTLV